MMLMNECIFCKIVSGEFPSKKVYEDEHAVAFLDINPATPGHTLVVSKKHYENIFSISDSDLEGLVLGVKRTAKIIKEKLGIDNINIMQNNGKFAGQLVPHMHFHIIPRYPDDRVVISFPRVKVDEEGLEALRKKMTEEEKKKPDFLDSDW